MKSEKSEISYKTIKRQVTITGLTDLMFDRYPGDNRTQLEPYQKVYLTPGTEELCLPNTNIMSALTAENTNSFPRILMDKRKYKDFARAILSYISISPTSIPILRDGKKVTMGKNLQSDNDPVSGLYIHRTVARLAKGIPNPKVRPVLPLPWSMDFTITIMQNSSFKEQELRNILNQGGLALGIGTFRGVFGKFEITKWE